MLTSKRSFLSYSAATWAPLSSSALFILQASLTTEHEHLNNFAHLHFSCTAFLALSFHREKRQRPHHKTHSLIRSLLCNWEGCFCLVRNTRPQSSQDSVSIKKNKEHMAIGYPVPSLTGNHFIAHSENAGAIVHSPKPLKPPCFHSTVNNDLW